MAAVDPASQDVGQGDTFTVNIAVDPNGYGIAGGELNVAFDASAMTATGITFGGRFGGRGGRWADVAGGVVLLTIGLRILLGHLR